MSITGVSLFLAVLLGTAGCSAGKAVGTDEYHDRVNACDLLDERTMVELSGQLSEAPRAEPTQHNREDLDWTNCRREFVATPAEHDFSYDGSQPDRKGTPALRYIRVEVFRFLGSGGKSGAEQARHWLRSYAAEPVAVADLGIDEAHLLFQHNGVQSFARVNAIDKNLALILEYGGEDVHGKPPGMPEDEARAGVTRLLKELAARRPCPTPNC